MMPTLEKRLHMRNHPDEIVIMHQDWRNLLFLHWKCDKSFIQKKLPNGLYIDTYNLDAYITITPFFIKNFRIFGIPYRYFFEFIEINVRTYVYDKNGIPGIWFFSLDINDIPCVFGANKIFSLPYIYSRLEGKKQNNIILIKGYRPKEEESFMEFIFQAHDCGHEVDSNSLDFFLIERYVMFSYKKNRGLQLNQIHHKPYLISKDISYSCSHNLLQLNKLNLSNTIDCVHFSPGVNVDIFKGRKVK